MKRPVLLGGREGLKVRSRALYLLWTWLPVLLCLCVVGGESTDTFSSAHTSGWLRHLAEAIFGPITQDTWEQAHHHIRKAGHFIGYGLVGLSWLRAWLLTWLFPLQRRPATRWRAFGVAMALCCTMVSASLDELHQTVIPSRTGLASDAWLDTSGAAALMLIVALCWRGERRSNL